MNMYKDIEIDTSYVKGYGDALVVRDKVTGDILFEDIYPQSPHMATWHRSFESMASKFYDLGRNSVLGTGKRMGTPKGVQNLVNDWRK